MQCKCGASTTQRESRRKRVVLQFDECQHCGRCGCYRLIDDGQHLASGLEAKERYNAIAAEA